MHDVDLTWNPGFDAVDMAVLDAWDIRDDHGDIATGQTTHSGHVPEWPMMGLHTVCCGRLKGFVAVVGRLVDNICTSGGGSRPDRLRCYRGNPHRPMCKPARQSGRWP